MLIVLSLAAAAVAFGVNEWRVALASSASASCEAYWAATCLAFATAVAALTVAGYTIAQLS